MSKSSKPVLRYLVQCACAPETFEVLPPLDRARLLEEAAQVLPDDEAAIALRTAALYRQSEGAQTKFLQLLSTEDGQ